MNIDLQVMMATPSLTRVILTHIQYDVDVTSSISLHNYFVIKKQKKQ